jgi:ligand-binding sensor domain-containing protein/signal transduction histidine kinase
MGTPATALRAGLTGFILLIAAEAVHTERLSITAYTVADGLPHLYVKKIVTDSRGFVWFATRRGLSRFDGRQFLTYSTQDGLSIPSVNHLLITSHGDYWVATNGGGVCRLRTAVRDEQPRDRASPLFTMCVARETADSNRVNVLYEDRSGQIWAGSDGGLLRLAQTGEQITLEPVALDLPGRADRAVQIWRFAEGRDGTLWIGTSWGLVRRLPGGATFHYRVAPAQGADHVRAVMVDEGDRMWIGHDTGLIVFRPDPLDPNTHTDRSRSLKIQSRSYSPRPKLAQATGEAVRIPAVSGSASEEVFALHRSSDGNVWIGSRHGLTQFDGTQLTHYGSVQGVAHVSAVAEDNAGHIWIAGVSGAFRLARTGFVTYSLADGLPSRVRSLFESASGELVVSGWPWIHRFDGARFTRVALNLTADRREVELRAPVLQTRAGEWWVPAGAGLYRFPAVRALQHLGRVQPTAIYTTRDGLAGDDVYRLFEDSRGNVWIATWAPARTVLTRWNRATDRFERFTEHDGLPPFSRPLAFGEDRSGGVWIGFWNGGVARYHRGRFTLFTANDGVPSGAIGHLYTDPNGRLWMGASGGGVTRIDAPDSDRPQFVHYTAAQGLSGDIVTAITGDREGHIYVGIFSTPGIASSIDRLDTVTGRIRQYMLPPGFEGSEVETAFCDRQGTLWFGTTSGGLLSLVPSREDPSSPPSIYIGGVRIGGAAYDVAALGEASVEGLELKPDQNQLEIEYFSVTAASPVRFQYRLEGADREWSTPTPQQSIHYANLPSGRYRFTVRAIGADSQVSIQPASVAFQIAPPFWRQWWFVTIGVMLAVLGAYGLHRFRVTRLVELERVRTRIATDLHDDIGSSLTQIAILTEVAQRRITGDDPAVVEPISRVSSISRELVDSMSDIVWAINPSHDRLGDLSARMRRFATDVLTSRHIALRFHSPERALDVSMGADYRRQCFLVFKEAIHNAVRHARCTDVTVAIALSGRSLVLTITDNGIGFDPSRATPGQGLRSMDERVRAMGGRVTVTSRPGEGTTVRFVIPLDRRSAPRRPRADAHVPRPTHESPINVAGVGSPRS